MKPTVIGSTGRSTITEVAAPPMPVVQMNTGAVVLRPEQEPKAREALQHTLDGFLFRLDKRSATRVFALFGERRKHVGHRRLRDDAA